MGLAEEIAKLNDLKLSGAISEQEFQEAKASLLAKNRPAEQKFKATVDGLSSDVNMWGMLIHLSQFCGYIIPLAGFIVPIVLWQMKKDEAEILDRHGRIVVNWIITEFIFGIVFFLLVFLGIGILFLLILGALGIVFPIIGGIKANSGEAWPYPCSLSFF